MDDPLENVDKQVWHALQRLESSQSLPGQLHQPSLAESYEPSVHEATSNAWDMRKEVGAASQAFLSTPSVSSRSQKSRSRPNAEAHPPKPLSQTVSTPPVTAPFRHVGPWAPSLRCMKAVKAIELGKDSIEGIEIVPSDAASVVFGSFEGLKVWRISFVSVWEAL